MTGSIRFTIFLLSIAFLCSAGCVSKAGERAGAASASGQTGMASWYGGRWIGRLTASGERYRAADMTAAHRSLRFGTMVRVTNLRNNRTTVVRINNRGPYTKGRILDLSQRAATDLGMMGSGVAKVRVEVLAGEQLATAKLAMVGSSGS